VITSSQPVGDWSWEVTSDAGTFEPVRAAEVVVAVWDLLARQELAVPVGSVNVSVRASGDSRDVRLQAEGLVLEPEPLSPGTALSRAVAEATSTAGDVVVSVRIQCPGIWMESGVRHRAEKLFVIQAEIWKRALLVLTLETYADAWLTVDTRDRKQPEVHAENAPRLAAALGEISSLLGCAPTPGEPNRFATPAETGFEDPQIEGPAYDDPWGTFEVPARSRLLRSRLPASEDEYEETTDHPVRYFTVRRDRQTVGFVWASTEGDAAGYEPRTAAGLKAFESGTGWLLRLREAHSQGIDALTALTWVRQNPPQPEFGVIAEDNPQEAPSLDALEELSGRY
jgi:hypothetical protein